MMYSQEYVDLLINALKQAQKRMKNSCGAIESNQVVDKDVHGNLTKGIDEIDDILKAPARHTKRTKEKGVKFEPFPGETISELGPLSDSIKSFAKDRRY